MKTITFFTFIAFLTYVVSAMYEAKEIALISLVISFMCLIGLMYLGYKNLMK